MGSSAAEESTHSFCLFSFQLLYWVLYLNHLPLFYDEGCIPAHLQVVYAVSQGQGPGRMSFSREEKWNLSLMQTRQEGRKERLAYSQKDSKTPKSEPDRFSQQLRSSARNSVIWSLITELTGSRACVELGTFLCFESRDKH